MSGPNWRAWLAAAAIFLLGLCIGGAGMAWIGVRIFRHALLNPGARTLADRATERVGNDLTRNLKLTPDESAEVKSLLAQTAIDLKGIRAQTVAQVSTEVRGTVKRIAAALPPDKRLEFFRLVSKRYERLGLPAPLPDETP